MSTPTENIVAIYVSEGKSFTSMREALVAANTASSLRDGQPIDIKVGYILADQLQYLTSVTMTRREFRRKSKRIKKAQQRLRVA
ncbi:hypothetical protein [Schlesneria paludicola]|uniref:hypothetical protein n=1 Tax=Schlesneria paludicola TaxID=360056 RepID=UPI00029A4377|nr:hypothetical protein [Schlesneria paludicola]